MMKYMIIILAIVMGCLFAVVVTADTVELAAPDILTEIVQATAGDAMPEEISCEITHTIESRCRTAEISFVDTFTQMTAFEAKPFLAEYHTANSAEYALKNTMEDSLQKRLYCNGNGDGQAYINTAMEHDRSKIPDGIVCGLNQTMGTVNDKTVIYDGRGQRLRA